jgi:hypothetical protein
MRRSATTQGARGHSAVPSTPNQQLPCVPGTPVASTPSATARATPVPDFGGCRGRGSVTPKQTPAGVGAARASCTTASPRTPAAGMQTPGGGAACVPSMTPQQKALGYISPSYLLAVVLLVLMTCPSSSHCMSKVQLQPSVEQARPRWLPAELVCTDCVPPCASPTHASCRSTSHRTNARFD